MRASLAVIAIFLALGLIPGPRPGGPAPLAVQVSTTTLTIDTYPYAAFVEMRHSDEYNMDYPWLDWDAYEASGPATAPQDYTALVVENPWLRLTFLPELGGRLYGVTVKATGEELLYQNPVIKPNRWGPPADQQWWLAVGGIEWCLPVDEHGYEWGLPWDYDVGTAPEGATVTLWDTTATDRVRARISVFLPADRASFQVAPRLENLTSAPITFKFWHNAMLAPGPANTVGPELRFVMPIDRVMVHSRGDDYLPGEGQVMDWPVYGGVDYSRLGNWNKWLGFFAHPQAAEGWAGVYANGVRRGVARMFPPETASGVKGFGFGWADPIPASTWTDDDSFYVELHGGPSPTFWDTLTLDPGGSLEWTETWLPLRDLPALNRSTEEAALGLAAAEGDLEVGVVAAGQRALDLRLWRRSDCELLWEGADLSPAPGEAHTHVVTGLGLGPEEVVLAAFDGSELLAAAGGRPCWATERIYLPVVVSGGFAARGARCEITIRAFTRNRASSTEAPVHNPARSR